MDTWKWYSTSANEMTVPKTTSTTTGPHTNYVIFAESEVPWDNKWINSKDGNPTNTWVSALDFLFDKVNCNNKATPHEALAAITQYLHSGHGLTYHINGGQSAYIQNAKFNLTNYINKRLGKTVNCYDQAGAVYVSSRMLGIHSEFVFMGQTDYNGKPPFGYINATNLVGVGMCNNPFYPLASGTNKVAFLNAPSGVTDLVSPNRTGFRNHAFARHSDLIFDACAGPYLGSSNLVGYATASIDIASPQTRQWSPDGIRWGGNTNGVFSITEVNNAVDPAMQMVKGVQ